MLRGNFGWNSFKQHLTTASIQDPNNLWDLGGQNCGAVPQTSCLAAGYSSQGFGLPERELAVQRQRPLPGAHWASISASTSSAARAIRIPYYVRARRRGRRRHQPHATQSRSTRSTPTATTTSTSSTSACRRPSRSAASRSFRRPSSSTWPTPTPSCSGTSGPATTAHRRGTFTPEPVLQPDHRGAEPAHRAARPPGELLGADFGHFGARPGIPGGPFRFLAGVKPISRKSRRRRRVRPGARLVPAGRRPAAPAGHGAARSPATSSSSRSTRCAPTPSVSTATPAARRRTSIGSPPRDACSRPRTRTTSSRCRPTPTS